MTHRNQNKEEVCYPNGATEMFARKGKQHNGIEIKFVLFGKSTRVVIKMATDECLSIHMADKAADQTTSIDR